MTEFAESGHRPKRECSASPDPVDQFRRATGRGGERHPPLGLREWLLLASLAVALCVPPWLLGGMRPWAQWWMLGLAAVPFALLWLPLPGNMPTIRENARKLLCFPVFWFGLFFLLYIAVQSWNVSWSYTLGNDGKQWWMTKLPSDSYVSWLPTGMAAPFAQMNGWRVLIIFAVPLLWLCAFWIGLTRRRSVLLLAWAFALNGFCVTILLILQRLTGAEGIYWTIEGPNNYYGGPFTYRNHAGAYLNLVLGVQLALYFYYSARAQRVMQRSSPHLLLLFMAFMQAVGLMFCASRGALLTAALIIVCAVLLFIGQSLVGGRRGFAIGSAAGLFIAAIAYFMWPVMQQSFPELERRWQQSLRTLELDELDRDVRVLASQATYRMFSDNPWTGWGAGSFRWYFPVYQQQEERLHRVVDRRGRVRRTFWWQQAHNDWLQYPAEYGIIGCVPLAAILLYWLFAALRHIRRWGAWVLPLFVAVCSVLLHALVDFPLQNPPVILALACVIALPAKLLGVSAQLRKDSGR